MLLICRVFALAMALVVPVQGMAAVTAGICMSLGHHEPIVVDHAHTQHADQQDGHDHAMHSHSDAAAGEAAEGKAHCGPCMACCASASIAAPFALSISASPSHPLYVFSQYRPAGVEPAGLYRPPLAL